MKRVGKALLAAAVMTGAAFAEDTIPANIGISHALGLYRTEGAVVNYNLNLVNSRQQVLNGFDAAGISSSVNAVSTGYQASFITTYAGELNGSQASGVINRVRNDATGYQAAGLINSVRGNLCGFQGAGLLNKVKGNVNGGQAGFINIAGDVNGFQVGTINIARQMKGVPLGIINIAENGTVSMVAYGTNFSSANVGAKFIVNNFVSTITAGAGDADDDIEDPVAFASSWGYHIPFDPFYWEIDLASMIMGEIETQDRHNVQVRQFSGIRLTVGLDINSRVGIFAGTGAGVRSEDKNWDNPSFEQLYFAGVTVF